MRNLTNIRVKTITLLCFFSLLLFTSAKYPFQKKLWSYWSSQNINQTSLIVQTCYTKLRLNAEKAGFQYVLLNQKNIRNYIQDYDLKITQVRNKSEQKAVQHYADLIRFHIIHDHGGIWMDITEVLMDDFDWILNIMDEKYKPFITNRFSDEPDVILFYFGYYQNAAEHKIPHPHRKNETILYNEFPGYEIWFFAAKKQNPLIGAIKQAYSQFTQMKLADMQKKFVKESIFMQTVDVSPYLSGNMAISYVLQKKQQQLDANLTVFSQRKSVYEYYNLWSLSALLGPLTWTNYKSISREDFIDKPKSYFQEKGAKLYFFIKIVGDFSKMITQKIQLLKQIFAKNSFDQFIKSNPSKQQCDKIRFITEGSIVNQIFQNTTHLQKINVTIISQEQNKRWNEYCSQYETLWTRLFYGIEFFFFDEHLVSIQCNNIHETINWEQIQKMPTLEWLKTKIFINRQILSLWLRILFDITLVYGAQLIIIKMVYRNFIKKQNSRNQGSSSSIISTNYFHFLMIAAVFVNFTAYFFVTAYGKTQSLFHITVAVIFSYFIRRKIEKTFKNAAISSSQNGHLDANDRNRRGLYMISLINEEHLLQITVPYQLLLPFISVWNSYIILGFFTKAHYWSYIQAVILGFVLPCLNKLYDKIIASQSNWDILRTKDQNNPHQQSQSWLFSVIKNILSTHYQLFENNIHRYVIIALIVFLNIFQNLRFLVFEGKYIIEYLPFVPLAYVGFIFGCILWVSLKMKVYEQIVRLIVLGLSVFIFAGLSNQMYGKQTWYTYDLFWYFIMFTLFQAIYIQIGNEVDNKDKFSEKTKISFKSVSINMRNLKYGIYCILPLVQLLFGSYGMNMFSTNDFKKHEIFILYCNSILLSIMSFYINFHKEQQYQRQRQIKEQDEMEQLSYFSNKFDQNYSNVQQIYRH